MIHMRYPRRSINIGWKPAVTGSVILVLSFLSTQSYSQSKRGREPIFSPSKFELRETSVVENGQECQPSLPGSKVFSDTTEVIRVGDEIFYQAQRFYVHGRGDGLVIENVAKRTCRIVPMFAIAETGGWYRRPTPSEHTPDAPRGTQLVSDAIWMGGNGVGIMVLDLKSRTWTRHDTKRLAITGDHMSVDFADGEYAFATHGEFPNSAIHIYSFRRGRWLTLKSVPTRLVRSYGHTSGEMVQVPVDHRQFAKNSFMPIDWSFMHPQVRRSGDGYLLTVDLGEGKTVFELPVQELQKAFQRR